MDPEEYAPGSEPPDPDTPWAGFDDEEERDEPDCN